MRYACGMRKLSLLTMCALYSTGQAPPAGKLTGDDLRGFREYVTFQLMKLPDAVDQATASYEIAKTYAAGEQWTEAIEWLRKVNALHAGIDPSRDAAFANLRGTKEFAEIMDGVRRDTPPVEHSQVAFTIAEGDLQPESMAFDFASKQFFFGSMSKGKVVKCSREGKCSDFATGLGVVLGLKADGRGLWVLSNSDHESSLVHFDIAAGRLIRKYSESGEHNFNDLAIAKSGEIYLSDTRANAVWRLAKDELRRIDGAFPHANGIALSGDEKLLYVSTFPDGITMVDLKTGELKPIKRPAGLCLAAIDGLYWHYNILIAIQNGFMNPRVVRLGLSRDGRSIENFDVLERRNPLFDGVTTGVIAGGEFFYMANIQDEKKSGFEAIKILNINLGRE